MGKLIVWIGLTSLGAVMALIDWRRFRRPWLGLALLAALAAAYGSTSLFRADDKSAAFIAAVFLVIAAAFGLCGYALVAFAWVVSRQLARLRGPGSD